MDRTELKSYLQKILKTIVDSPQQFTGKAKEALKTVLQRVSSLIQQPEVKEEISENIPEIPANITEIIPEPLSNDQKETIGMLWQLSGGNPQIFQSYIDTFPDETLQRALSTEQGISEMMGLIGAGPPPTPPGGGETPPGQIPSSNVFFTDYDPLTQQMLVKFNGKDRRDSGPSYVYGGVPPEIADMVETGAIPAKTLGKNKFGSWWPGKKPSVGASTSELLKNGPFPYQKVG